ncbi:hypothetical protein B0H19DRAFT_1124428 [Mycena capillaripes]|nr:hypothetical protein B0H19DRAFT_1124428 [Mycena capillaripes]
MSLHSPSLGPASPSPSSSAVTIPIPGRSILKKPPPVQTGLFSASLSRLGSLFNKDSNANANSGSGAGIAGGNNSGGGSAGKNEGIGAGGKDEAARVLRRAHFILPEIAVVYPISSLAPPSTPALRDEKRAIEERERERRRRVVRANSYSSLASGSPSASASASPSTGSGDTASVVTTSTREREGGEESEWWAMDKVESFYRECCEGCQEPPDKGITAAFKATPPTHPRTVDFSGVQLTFTSASILADVLSIEWGLRKAVFRECDLEEMTLKPLLHALLIPRSLAYLSLASNRRLKAGAWRVVGAYVGKAHTLTFLDLSSNLLDKKAVECVVAALGEYVPQERSITSSGASFVSLSDTASIHSYDSASNNNNNPYASEARYGLGYGLKDKERDKERERDERHPGQRGLVSLKLDDCGLRAAALETLSRAVRTSSLRNISLRHNKISPTGAVALALMIRDYPDVLAAPGSASSSSGFGSGYGSVPPSPTVGHHHHTGFDLANAPPLPHHPTYNNTHTNSGGSSPILPPSLSAGGKLPPPPRHPAATLTAAQTTYTPYVPRRRQQSASAAPPPGRPVVASSVLGGVTARHVPSPANSIHLESPTKAGVVLGLGGAAEREAREREARERELAQQKERERDGPSAALLDKVRALDALPRVGALRTLDLRGNDLRTGITYIAQVLKRNRTLKVLNLAENKLDVACLVSLAEALKYNSSLETLDLSRNPCSGPGLEGIQSLRTAFTLNTALKRLFLSSTGMGSPGAIALAEFLPESASLLHLDLTENALGVAGVLALSKGLEANFVMRCLDLNIPPGDEEFARMCRDILNACVRNTEEAERVAAERAGGGGSGSGTQTPVGNGNGSAAGAGLMTGVNGMSTLGSGRGHGKGLWNMIEESELAKSIRLDEEKKSESDVAVRARACIALLEAMLVPPPIAPPSPTAAAAQPPPSPADVLKQARALTRELSTVIQATEDPSRMEELLDVNDTLMTLVARVPPPGRPTLTLQGLGLKWAPGAGPAAASPSLENGHSPLAGNEGVNGHVDVGEEDHTPTTPRIDKGKARAVPEPEEPEKVLSPTLMLGDDEDDEDGEGRLRFSPVEEGEDDDGETVIGASPNDRSRSWVEEEGEVFRKGTVLLTEEEMDGEYAGEDLRKELLEAMVERPPPRPLTDQFGMEIIPQEQPQQQQEPPPTSPQPASPAVEKPSPRPYVSRRSSSASIMSMISPTIASFTSGSAKIPEDGQASPRTPSSPVPSSPSLGAGARPYLPRSRSSSTPLDR